MNESTLKQSTYWGGNFILLFAFLFSICNINDPLFFVGFAVTGLFCWTIKKYKLKITRFDIGVILVWIYSFIQILLSQEDIVSFIYFRTFTLTVFFYFSMRLYLEDKGRLKSFLLWCSIIIGLICFVAFFSFLLFKQGIEGLGFSNLYDFRYRYRPAGFLTNVWGTLLLGFFAIVSLTMLLYRENRSIFYSLCGIIYLIIFEIVISFSRGIYIAFSFMVLAGLFILFWDKSRKSKKVLFMFLLCIPIFISGILFEKDVRQTLKFKETVSQQRSISGRSMAISSSLEIFKENPVIGTGPGTFAMVMNDSRYEDDNIVYTGFAPNSYTQLWTEQGIIGIILWFLLFLLLFFNKTTFSKEFYILKSYIIIFFFTLFIRESTFPVFFELGGYQIVIFILAALFINFTQKSNYVFTVSEKYTNYIIFTIVIICISILSYTLLHTVHNNNNDRALVLLEENNLEESIKFISATSQRTPYLINRSIIYAEAYNNQKDPVLLSEAWKNLEKAIVKNKHDRMLGCMKANLFNLEEKTDSALYLLNNLVLDFPNNSFYNFALFDTLYKIEEKEKALPYIIRTLFLFPRFVESEYWKKLMSDDREFAQSTVLHLYNEFEESSLITDPIQQAKYGCLLFYMGQYDEAEVKLEKAVELMPSLAYPWFFLYQIREMQGNSDIQLLKRFLFLSYNIQSETVMNRLISSGEIMQLWQKNNFLQNRYAEKFFSWYKSHTIDLTEEYFQ